MVENKKRIILSAGHRRDIEQTGASLTNTTDILGRSYASSGLFTLGSNDKLTRVNLSSIAIEMEPVKNLTFGAGFSYRTLASASTVFKLDYYTDLDAKTKKSELEQAEVSFNVEYTPKRKPIGFAVERYNADSPFTRLFVNYRQGFKGLFSSDFNYQKIQVYFKQPIIIGPLGRSNIIAELGKTFGTIPLGLMSVVPGNQTYFTIDNTFSNLNFYEFVTDQYATLQWDHNFNGRLLSRIPFMRKLNWREIIAVRGVFGTISEENTNVNASDLIYKAPEKPYWEYSAGIGNIFKVFRIDFSWRGNYLNSPDATKFAVKGSFGFFF
jgi:hypothetical protein